MAGPISFWPNWKDLLSNLVGSFSPRGAQRTSTLQDIQLAQSAQELYVTILSAEEEIITDVTCVAYVRLLASDFLFRELFRSVDRLNVRTLACRLDQVSRSGFRQQKQQEQRTCQDRRRLRSIHDTLLEFAGLHLVALDEIRAALRTRSVSRLTGAVITASRQASSFMHDISECKSLSELQRMIQEAVLTSIGTSNSTIQRHTILNHANGIISTDRSSERLVNTIASATQASSSTSSATKAAATAAAAAAAAAAGSSTSTPPSVLSDVERQKRKQNEDKAGDVGKFLNYGSLNVGTRPPTNKSAPSTSFSPSSPSPSSTTASQSSSLSARDVSLMLEIVKNELRQVSSVHKRLSRMVEHEFGTGWDVQRRPLRYAGITLVLAQTGRALCIHSRFLGGTGQLEDQLLRYKLISQAFIRNQLTTPMLSFYNKIFSTATTEVFDEESVSLARSSLRSMLVDFSKQYLSDIPNAEQIAQLGSMSAVMDSIAEQIRHPFRNVVSGSLVQAILLQVQKVKCDVDELMLKTKQILRAQELNLALVALVPALLTILSLAYLTSTAAYLWRSRDTHLIVSGCQTIRFLLGDIHSSFLALQRDGASPIEDDEPIFDDTFNETNDRHDSTVVDHDGRARNLSSNPVLRKLRALGALHSKLFTLQDVINNDLVNMASEVKLRFLDDIKLLRNSLVSLDDRKSHVLRMLLCYPLLRD